MIDAALMARKKRLREIREALGLTQEKFLPVLNSEAAKLGVREYNQSTLSKIEGGPQVVTFDDVAVYAACDPERRGKLWLAWGEAADESQRGGPVFGIQPKQRRSVAEELAATQKPAAKVAVGRKPGVRNRPA